MHLEGPCKPIDPGIEAAASFFNSTGRRKQKTRPLKIEISANGRGFLELAYLEVGGAKRRGVLKKGGLAAGTRIPKNEPALLV